MRQMIFKMAIWSAAPIAIILSVIALGILAVISFGDVDRTEVTTLNNEVEVTTLSPTQIEHLSVYRDHIYN